MILRPVLDRHLLRVPRPHEFQLDEDMEGWLQNTMELIDKCAIRKDAGVLAYRERRRSRLSRVIAPTTREETCAGESGQGRPATGSGSSQPSSGLPHLVAAGSSAVQPGPLPTTVSDAAPDDLSLMARGRPKRSRSPVRRGTTTGGSGHAGGGDRNGPWRDWTDDNRWEREDSRVTRTHRALAPRAPRDACPASSSWEGRPAYERTVPRATPAVDPAAPTPMSTAEAVDLWRKLLHLDTSTAMGEMDRSVQNGGRAIGRETADNMVDTLRDLDMHDLSMMTIGLVDLLRRIMAECSQVLAFARNDLVEVEVEQDQQSLMQSSMSAPTAPTTSLTPSGTTTLTDVQGELHRLRHVGWDIGPYVAGLFQRLRQHRLLHGNCEQLDLLDSLLVAMRDDGECGDSLGSECVSKPVLDWLQIWWPRLVRGCAASSSGMSSVAPVVSVLDTQLDEAEELAHAEHEYHREQFEMSELRNMQQAAFEKEEAEWEEAMDLAARECEQAQGASQSQSGDDGSFWSSEMDRIEAMYQAARRRRRANWRAWDDWAMHDEMTKPTSRIRKWVEVDLKAVGDNAEEIKKLKVPLPSNCSPDVEILNARIVSMASTSSPTSSAPTVVVPNVVGPMPATTADSQPAQPSSSPCVPIDLQYSEYAAQYARYRRGRSQRSTLRPCGGSMSGTSWLLRMRLSVWRLMHFVKILLQMMYRVRRSQGRMQWDRMKRVCLEMVVWVRTLMLAMSAQHKLERSRAVPRIAQGP